MVCVTDPVLAPKPTEPPNVALMVSNPTGRVDVTSDALPPTKLAVPSFVDPIVNVTVPVGMPEADATVAVSITDSPEFDGFGDDMRVVIVVASWLHCNIETTACHCGNIGLYFVCAVKWTEFGSRDHAP